MKLQVMSDVHVEFYVRPRELPGRELDVPDVGADVLILAGDIGVGPQGVRWAAGQADRLGVPCVYVAGNHEYYHWERDTALLEMRKAAGNTRVHFLENDQVVIGDVRFLGCTLWTDLAAYVEPGWQGLAPERILERNLMDYRVIRVAGPDGRERSLRASDTQAWHRSSLAWLHQRLREPFDGRTVVVTHHGPSYACQHPSHPLDWMANGFYSPLFEMEAVPLERIDLWVYGHTHACLDTVVGGIHLVSNQAGYPHEDVPGGFDPRKVWEV